MEPANLVDPRLPPISAHILIYSSITARIPFLSHHMWLSNTDEEDDFRPFVSQILTL